MKNLEEKTQMKKSWRNGRIWWARKHKIRKNQSSTELILWKLIGKNQARLFKKKSKAQRKLKSKIEPNYSYLDINNIRFYE